mgnify:CR=1 FL=1
MYRRDLFKKLKGRMWGNPRVNTDFYFPSDLNMTDFDFPDADIQDLGKSIRVTLDMPGINKENIKIDLQSDFLEVRAVKTQKQEGDEENYYLAERSYEGFFRKMTLPEDIVPEEAKAKYENGVLTITIPKAEIEKSQISIE